MPLAATIDSPIPLVLASLMVWTSGDDWSLYRSYRSPPGGGGMGGDSRESADGGGAGNIGRLTPPK